MSAILFLDIDGVLNHEGVFRDKRFGPFPIDHECVERIHEVVRETGCRIVLSSSWRGMTQLEDKLAGDQVFDVYHEGEGLELGDWLNVRHQDGSTKRLKGHRGDEIAEWLSRHPEVENYAIVDDDADMLPEQMPRFVQTAFQDGLTQEAAEKLSALLSPPPPIVQKGVET